MRFYLAARYSRREELVGYRAELLARGHIVTSRWLDGDHDISDAGLSEEASAEKRTRFALDDFEDVQNAERLIAFTEAPRSALTRGGRHVEFGMALFGHVIPPIVIGPRENVFHCLPGIEVYPTFEDYLRDADYIAEISAPLNVR